MQRYPESPYLCMCERWGGAPGHPWRCDGGAYGLHVPHSGESQKFPFLALAFYGSFQCPKKAIFGPTQDGGHGARMRLHDISRDDFGHPGRADTCRDSLNGCISACVITRRVPPNTPGDLMGVHTGSMSPIRGRHKNCLFWHLPFLEISKWPKKEIFLSSWIGDMEPICTPLRSLGLIFFTPVGLTHAEISRLSISLHV